MQINSRIFYSPRSDLITQCRADLSFQIKSQELCLVCENHREAREEVLQELLKRDSLSQILACVVRSKFGITTAF